MLSAALRRRATGAVVSLLVIGAPVLTTATAHGDSIGDVQARAQQVADQLDQLQGEITADSAAWEGAQGQLAQIQASIDTSRTKVAQARRDVDQKRKQLADYALNLYVTGGDSGGLPDVLSSSADQNDQRDGYAGVAAGDRQQLIDDLQAAQQVEADQIRQLDGQQAQATQVANDAKAKQQQAEAAASQLASIKSQLDGKLAQLVAAKQAAEAKAAQARAYAEAQAQARAAAAAQAQAAASAQAPVVPAPQPTSQPDDPGSVPSPPAPSPATEQPPTFVPPPDASAAQTAIAAAESRLGDAYVWGARGPDTFDCSGLIDWSYLQAGIDFNGAATWGLMNDGTVVSLSQIQPGDMVFYLGGDHVALYVGGGEVIHAPSTGDVVRYASLYMMPPYLVVRPT